MTVPEPASGSVWCVKRVSDRADQRAGSGLPHATLTSEPLITAPHRSVSVARSSDFGVVLTSPGIRSRPENKTHRYPYRPAKSEPLVAQMAGGVSFESGCAMQRTIRSARARVKRGASAADMWDHSGRLYPCSCG